jgi:hypothetical protein
VAASPELKDCGEVQPASALLFVPSSLVQVSPKFRMLDYISQWKLETTQTMFRKSLAKKKNLFQLAWNNNKTKPIIS